MINKPYHKLTKEEKEKYLKLGSYSHEFPNRQQRRSSDSNKNLVRQEIPVKDSRGNYSHHTPVFHKKSNNIPYQYLGIKAVKGSIAENREKARLAAATV